MSAAHESDYYAPAMSAIACGSIMLQFMLPYAPAFCAVLSPVSASCCALILLALHPRVGALVARVNTLGTSEQAVLLSDPAVHAALRLPHPPPPWMANVVACALHAVADLLMGVQAVYAEPGAPRHRAFEAGHDLAAGASLCCWLYASWRLGTAPTRFLGVLCWGIAASAAVQISLAAPLPDNEWVGVTCAALATLRIFASWALAAHSACALAGAVVALGHGRALAACDVDIGRWISLAVGAVLMASPPVMATMLGVHPGALGLAAERLGIASLTLSAYLANFPPIEAEESSVGRHESLAEMREAHRRKRAAAAALREPPPPPLMADSWRLQGGVQGLGCHDALLHTDADGDEAHEFWEESSAGLLRRCD